MSGRPTTRIALTVCTGRSTTGSPLTPFLRESEFKDAGCGGSNVLLDCTWPFDWSEEETPIREAFLTSYPEAIKEKALIIAE